MQKRLQNAYQVTRNAQNENEDKNYYSLSLQHFFKNMSDKQREELCDGYIENWIQVEKVKMVNKLNLTPKILNSAKCEANAKIEKNEDFG